MVDTPPLNFSLFLLKEKYPGTLALSLPLRLVSLRVIKSGFSTSAISLILSFFDVYPSVFECIIFISILLFLFLALDLLFGFLLLFTILGSSASFSFSGFSLTSLVGGGWENPVVRDV